LEEFQIEIALLVDQITCRRKLINFILPITVHDEKRIRQSRRPSYSSCLMP